MHGRDKESCGREDTNKRIAKVLIIMLSYSWLTDYFNIRNIVN